MWIFIRRCFENIWATCVFATLLTRPDMYSNCTIQFFLLCLIFKIKVLDLHPETLRRLETCIFLVSRRIINFVVRICLFIRLSVHLSVSLSRFAYDDTTRILWIPVVYSIIIIYCVAFSLFVNVLYWNDCILNILNKIHIDLAFCDNIISTLTAAKDHVIKYSETAFSNSNVNYFWSIKNSSEVIEKLRLRNYQGSQVSSFDFSTLYTALPHDLIKAKLLSLVNWCFNTESKTYLCTSHKAGCLAARSIARINVGLALSYVKLLLSSWKTYMWNLKVWFINN